MDKRKSNKKSIAKKHYEGFSLIETILTLIIISIVMLMVSLTLSTLAKVSIMSDMKIRTGDETDTALTILSRSISQSTLDRIYLYNTMVGSANTVRVYNEETERIENSSAAGEIANRFNTPLTEEDLTGATPVYATEVHILPFDSDRWICIGYFKSKQNPSQGYIMKSSYQNLSNHQDCFDSSTSEYTKNAMLLNTSVVNIQQFNISFFVSGGNNGVFTAMITAVPNRWIGEVSPTPIKRTITVTTEKIDY